MLSSQFEGTNFKVGDKTIIYLSLDASKLKTNVTSVEVQLN